MDVETVPLALAFVAGTASFLSPCHLAVVPAYLAVLGGAAAPRSGNVDRRTLARHAVLFAIGFSIVIVALGTSVGLVGYLVWDRVPLLRKVAGVLLLVFGLHTMGLLRIPLLYREVRWQSESQTGQSCWTALLMGLASGVGWTPCVGPVLAAILLLAAESATAFEGGALLAVYAAGLSLPFVALALLMGRTPKLLATMRRVSRGVQPASGVLLLLMGVLLFTNQFQRVAALLGTWAPL